MAKEKTQRPQKTTKKSSTKKSTRVDSRAADRHGNPGTIRRLKDELAASKDHLQCVVKQLESSNQEYQASNEEVMGINEELSTVNQQLAAKVEELETKHADLQNLPDATDVATICLDTDLSIRWFTRAAQRVIRLRDADKGRPLADFSKDVQVGHLVEVAARVLKKLTPVEDETVCADGRAFLRHVTPYRTDNQHVGGVVITFVDITERKMAENALATAKELSDKIIDTVREATLVLDTNLRVVRANRSFYDKFEVSPAETDGCLVYELGNNQWDIPELRRLLEDVLPRNHVFNDYVVDHHFETIGRRVMVLNGRRIDNIQQILLTIEDITELLSAKEALEHQVADRTEMLNLLQDVTRSANQARTVDEAMSAALERIGRYNSWQVGHVWKPADDGSGQFISSGIWYVTETADKAIGRLDEFQRICQKTRYSAGEGLVGAVLRTGQPQWIDNIAKSAAWRRGDAAHLGVRAAIAFPVTVDGEVAAVLEFFSDHPARREERFMEIMPDIGIQLGHVIERKRLEHEVAQATEREQRRIGADIHDGVGQELTGLRYLAQTHSESLARQGSDDVSVAQRILKGFETVQRQLRAIIRDLVPVEVDRHGLVAALQTLAERTDKAYDVACTFECETPFAVEDTLLATHIYRIAQEAVNNAIRHAEADHIFIRLMERDGELDLQIFDDGVGIDAEPFNKAGFGVRGMRYRAELIGARLAVSAREAGGTAVVCQVPMRKPDQNESSR